ELYGLLEANQHLLERLHAQDLLQPALLQAEGPGARAGPSTEGVGSTPSPPRWRSTRLAMPVATGGWSSPSAPTSSPVSSPCGASAPRSRSAATSRASAPAGSWACTP